MRAPPRRRWFYNNTSGGGPEETRRAYSPPPTTSFWVQQVLCAPLPPLAADRVRPPPPVHQCRVFVTSVRACVPRVRFLSISPQSPPTYRRRVHQTRNSSVAAAAANGRTLNSRYRVRAHRFLLCTRSLRASGFRVRFVFFHVLRGFCVFAFCPFQRSCCACRPLRISTHSITLVMETANGKSSEYYCTQVLIGVKGCER